MTFSEWLKKSLLTISTNKGAQNQQFFTPDRDLLLSDKVNFDHIKEQNEEDFNKFVLPSIVPSQSLSMNTTWYEQPLKLSVITEFFPRLRCYRTVD